MGYVSFREGMLIDFPIGSGIPKRLWIQISTFRRPDHEHHELSQSPKRRP